MVCVKKPELKPELIKDLNKHQSMLASQKRIMEEKKNEIKLFSSESKALEVQTE